jgi:ornithine cyclodeaminase/alanine dehydrogenase-like protein (mu-crystallin family)
MQADGIPFISGDAIRGGVPIRDVMDAVAVAFRDVAAGRDRSPIRSRVELPGGDLLLMPGIREGATGATVKLVTVMRDNPAHGLPSVQALVVWLDAATGRARALLDGAAVTALRTGAASGVATGLLARPDASTLAMLGTGAQAEWQVRAVLAARPIRRVVVHSPTPDHRQRFAERMAQATEVEVTVASSAQEALAEADVVCCATTSATPVFDAAWLRGGTHVNGIGAFRLDMMELPPQLFARASLVAVDALPAALAEAGDLVAALERDLLPADAVVELGSVAADYAAARDPAAITVFKSVGLAIQDVAAAELATRLLLEETSTAVR